MCIFVHKKHKDRRHSLFKDILEDVFKSAIIGFKNGVLCAHVQGPLLANSILEAAVSKACDRLLWEKKHKQLMAALSVVQGLQQPSP